MSMKKESEFLLKYLEQFQQPGKSKLLSFSAKEVSAGSMASAKTSLTPLDHSPSSLETTEATPFHGTPTSKIHSS